MAAFEAPNNIIGLQAGTDTLIVSYNGISDSVPVQIVQTNIITRVHNIQQSIVHNCYPNPFNNITTIEYYLPQNSQVCVNVYDMIGNLIKTPVNGFKQEGYNKIEFSASGIKPGIYYYQIITGKMSVTGKMIIIK